MARWWARAMSWLRKAASVLWARLSRQPAGHHAVGQRPLQRVPGVEGGQHSQAVGGELGRVLVHDEFPLGPQPVLEGVAADAALALVRPRPGGLLCVPAIGLDLRVARHTMPLSPGVFAPWC